MPTSTLGQLFRYARGTRAEALENFTAEAIAAAAREDPAPLLQLLADHALIPAAFEPIDIAVHTQAHVRGAGIVDLVVDLLGSSGTAEVWLEVKVGAPESGVQMTNYKTWISGAGPSAPKLATLSPQRLPGHPDVTWISWMSVRRAAQSAATVNGYWADVRRYLEEIRMADASDEPIIAREAASLADAHSLYRKATRIVQAVTAIGKDRWPQFGWPKSPNDSDEQLLWQFKAHGRVTLPVRTPTPAKLLFGIVQTDVSAEFYKAEPHLAVWVEHAAKQGDFRRALIEQADRSGLDVPWKRRLPGWWALTASERLVAFDSHEAARDWVLARLEELDAAGVLALIGQAGGVTTFEESNP